MAKLEEFCFVIPGEAEKQFDPETGERLPWGLRTDYDFQKAYNEFDAWLEERILEMVERQDAGDASLAGMVISFSVADGKAFYLVTKDKPLTLQFIDTEYSVQDYVIRGLNKKDVTDLTRSMTAIRRFAMKRAAEQKEKEARS